MSETANHTNGANEPKPATKTKQKKPAGKAAKTAEKPTRTPVPKAVLEKFAKSGGKVKVITSRDEKLHGKTFAVISVRTCRKEDNGHGYYPVIRVGDVIRPVSPANVKPV